MTSFRRRVVIPEVEHNNNIQFSGGVEGGWWAKSRPSSLSQNGVRAEETPSDAVSLFLAVLVLFTLYAYILMYAHVYVCMCVCDTYASTHACHIHIHSILSKAYTHIITPLSRYSHRCVLYVRQKRTVDREVIRWNECMQHTYTFMYTCADPDVSMH